jgi:hypothetical protein
MNIIKISYPFLTLPFSFAYKLAKNLLDRVHAGGLYGM